MAITRKSGRGPDDTVGQADENAAAVRDGDGGGAPVDNYVRTVNPHVGPDELLDRLKPVVGPEIQATMLTQGQLLEKRIFDEGHKQGYNEGQTHDHKQGYDEGQRGLLLRQLTRRFGPLPASVGRRVSNASADELMQWSDRALDAESLDDVFAGL